MTTPEQNRSLTGLIPPIMRIFIPTFELNHAFLNISSTRLIVIFPSLQASRLEYEIANLCWNDVGAIL